MKNPRSEKVAVVQEVRERISSSEAVVITDYRGLDVLAMADLRQRLRKVGGDYKVYKNTLIRFATRELQLNLDEVLVGPTALAFVGDFGDGTPGDAVSLAKALCNFAQDSDFLSIKGGVLEGQVLSSADVVTLSQLGTRTEILSEIVGLLEAPLSELASLLEAPLSELASLLEAPLVELTGLVESLSEKQT
ncbi:MAG: 50S ribosomal protein L10 [Acidimicrobiia bacterium]|nr:50S ribosomal protein L10 [Acidimicrobiia bacterium]MYC57994.1 50S ribosomal protein L10 [Acidimicrobiia bacterium]MYG94682.1 50S ribosomal protein L10 [Acidimicrobiia bacterium]MYI31057.1 50S ribosomal protein L10 [Acidimicrobiia bacterium]